MTGLTGPGTETGVDSLQRDSSSLALKLDPERQKERGGGAGLGPERKYCSFDWASMEGQTLHLLSGLVLFATQVANVSYLSSRLYLSRALGAAK